MVLLFDQTKALEKAFGDEAAATLIKVLESQDAATRQELATKADLREMEIRLKAEIETKLAGAKSEIIKWVAAMLVAQAAAIAALVKLL